MIVEEEQQGHERAKCGDQLILGLSNKLSSDFGKGYSLTNIKQMRIDDENTKSVISQSANLGKRLLLFLVKRE